MKPKIKDCATFFKQNMYYCVVEKHGKQRIDDVDFQIYNHNHRKMKTMVVRVDQSRSTENNLVPENKFFLSQNHVSSDRAFYILFAKFNFKFIQSQIACFSVKS